MYSNEFIPARKFFWEVFGSLHYEDAMSFIAQERNNRYEKEEQENAKMMMVNPDILQELKAVKYFSKKKGRALFKAGDGERAPVDHARRAEERRMRIQESPIMKRSAMKKREKKAILHLEPVSASKHTNMNTDMQSAGSGRKHKTPGKKNRRVIEDNQIPFLNSAAK